MMPIGGEAPTVLAALWGMVCVTLVFVVLRLYTRLRIVDGYGIDDHFFNASFALLVLYGILITIATAFGFGQALEAIPSAADQTRAILFEAAGQTIVVAAVWSSKTSLACFLLRLQGGTGRRRCALLVPNVALGVAIAAAVVAWWLQCRPVAFMWDRNIPGGYCVPAASYPSDVAASISVFTDFWYAAFPWYLLWGVQMPRREKLLIQISLSLGVLAGACGVERAIQLSTLSHPEYLRDTAPLIVWHAAELSVTMVCIGIPVCRPLYQTWYRRFRAWNAPSTRLDEDVEGDGDGRSSTERAGKNGQIGVYTMHTIGGSEFASGGLDGAGGDKQGAGGFRNGNAVCVQGGESGRLKGTAKSGFGYASSVSGNRSHDSILGHAGR